jgi:hypothetical protein
MNVLYVSEINLYTKDVTFVIDSEIVGCETFPALSSVTLVGEATYYEKTYSLHIPGKRLATISDSRSMKNFADQFVQLVDSSTSRSDPSLFRP